MLVETRVGNEAHTHVDRLEMAWQCNYVVYHRLQSRHSWPYNILGLDKYQSLFVFRLLLSRMLSIVPILDHVGLAFVESSSTLISLAKTPNKD